MTIVTKTDLITPYGGELINLLVPDAAAAALRDHASHLHSIPLSRRAVCDLEMLAIGAFSPLDRFMGQADCQRVMDEMRLTNGTLFPIPITLPVEADSDLKIGQEIALRDTSNEILAVMTIEEIYPWNLEEMAQKVFGTLE